jgi:hypothetical protein
MDDDRAVVAYGENDRYRPWDEAKFDQTLSTWFTRPRKGHTYQLDLAVERAVEPEREALGEAGLSATLRPTPVNVPPLKPSVLKKILKSIPDEVTAGRLTAEEGAKEIESFEGMLASLAAGTRSPSRVHDSLVYIMFALDNFASPEDFRNWVGERSICSSAALVAAHAGVGLSKWHHNDARDAAINQRLVGTLLRYPALDFDNGNFLPMRLLDEDAPSADPDDAHYFRRAAWINVVSQRLVNRCGGVDGLRTMADAHPDVSLEACGTNFIVTAGPSPQPTGEPGTRLLAAARHINRWFVPAQRHHLAPRISGAPDDFQTLFMSLGESET